MFNTNYEFKFSTGSTDDGLMTVPLTSDGQVEMLNGNSNVILIGSNIVYGNLGSARATLTNSGSLFLNHYQYHFDQSASSEILSNNFAMSD